MTLDKAIEINQDTDLAFAGEFNQEQSNAIQLGIEALKRFQQQRQDPHCRGFWHLPGETKE